MSAGGDKTEQPTAKRLQEARKKGNIAKSKDLSAVSRYSNVTGITG
jgi:flagellar biosynthesis protein FlhB